MDGVWDGSIYMTRIEHDSVDFYATTTDDVYQCKLLVAILLCSLSLSLSMCRFQSFICTRTVNEFGARYYISGASVVVELPARVGTASMLVVVRHICFLLS
jgi:hypothetical protein